MTIYSFIIPAYNRAYCIENTINSISKQSFQKFEIIVVDDGSTDNTYELISHLSKNIDIKYIKLNKNSGVNIAKNTGAYSAQGQYLIFLDSDDLLICNESLYDMNEIIINNKQPGILMFACKDLDGNITNKNPSLNGHVSFPDYLKGKAKGEYLPVVKCEIFKKNHFFEDIKGGEGLTWQKIAKQEKYIFISSHVVRLYNNVNIDRLSFKNKNYYLRLSKVFFKDFKVNFQDYLHHYWWGLFNVLLKTIYYKILSF